MRNKVGEPFLVLLPKNPSNPFIFAFPTFTKLSFPHHFQSWLSSSSVCKTKINKRLSLVSSWSCCIHSETKLKFCVPPKCFVYCWGPSLLLAASLGLLGLGMIAFPSVVIVEWQKISLASFPLSPSEYRWGVSPVFVKNHHTWITNLQISLTFSWELLNFPPCAGKYFLKNIYFGFALIMWGQLLISIKNPRQNLNYMSNQI